MVAMKNKNQPGALEKTKQQTTAKKVMYVFRFFVVFMVIVVVMYQIRTEVHVDIGMRTPTAAIVENDGFSLGSGSLRSCKFMSPLLFGDNNCC